MQEDWRAKGGGAFNLSKTKTMIESVQHHAQQLPGPASYAPPPSTLRQQGAVLNVAKPASEVEQAMDRAAQVPAPGEKQPKYGFTSLRSNGGEISKTSGKSFLEQHLHERRHAPDPGLTFKDGYSSFGGLQGGAFNTAKSKTHLEWVLYHAAQLPSSADTHDGSHQLSTRVERPICGWCIWLPRRSNG